MWNLEKMLFFLMNGEISTTRVDKNKFMHKKSQFLLETILGPFTNIKTTSFHSTTIVIEQCAILLISFSHVGKKIYFFETQWVEYISTSFGCVRLLGGGPKPPICFSFWK